MKLTKRRILVLLLLLMGVGAFAAFMLKSAAPVQYYTAKVENGDIKQVVEATGTINAVITVQVGSQVSGVISKLYVDFNSPVKKGQLIAQIDPALFEGALAQAKADLANTKANLTAAIAATAKARATEVQAKADYQRNVIASLSLLVGGIGIMNIMLISVTERTREIGIRLAVGATEQDIQLQFLSEAVVMSLLGGALGALAGVLGSFLLHNTLNWTSKYQRGVWSSPACFPLAWPSSLAITPHARRPSSIQLRASVMSKPVFGWKEY